MNVNGTDPTPISGVGLNFPPSLAERLAELDATVADAARSTLAGLDPIALASVAQLVDQVHAAAWAAGAQQEALDAADVKPDCPGWCAHHSGDETTGERTHFGRREHVGPVEVQMVQTVRLADGRTVDSRAFLGDHMLTVDETRRAARLLWTYAGELDHSSTEATGGGAAETLEDDRYQMAVQHGLHCGRLLERYGARQVEPAGDGPVSAGAVNAAARERLDEYAAGPPAGTDPGVWYQRAAGALSACVRSLLGGAE